MNFDIIIDVTIDYFPEVIKSENIKVVPLYIITENQRIPIYKTNYDVFYKNTELQRKWLEGKLKTSQPSIKDFVDAIKSTNNKDVLILTLSSKLSGTYNVAVSASRLIKNKNIYIFDTKTASIGSGLFLKKAIELRNKGYTIKEVMDILKETKVKTYLIPMDINFLLKSGRLNIVKYLFLKTIKKKTLLRVNEEGKLELEKLVDKEDELFEYGKDSKEILHSSTPEFFDKIPDPKVLLNPIVAVNTGPEIAKAFIA